MKRLARSDVWFLLAVVALAAGGAVALAQPACTPLGEREATYYWAYETWRCAFDALSAACGVGLLTRDLAADYTTLGRWVLTAVGLGGALLYISAIAQSLRRMGASLTIWAVPRTLTILGLFLALQAVLVVLAVLVAALGRAGPSTDSTSLAEAARLAVVAFASLGLSGSAASESWTPIVLATIVWVGALGWPVWLLVIPPLMRKYVQGRQALVVAGGYCAWLALLALLMCVLQLPRSGVAARGDKPSTSGAVAFDARVVQVVSAAGAGLSTEPLADSDLRPGSKLVLSLAVLVGSGGYGGGGGIIWVLLIWALAGALLTGCEPPHARPWIRAGLSSVVLMGTLAVVGALGLMLIENLTGSRFEHAPSLDDALLEACSAVGGANLTTGLTVRLTSSNLVSGLRLPVNMYTLGMVWLMLLMLAGRMVPVLMLRRIADRLSSPRPTISAAADEGIRR